MFNPASTGASTGVLSIMFASVFQIEGHVGCYVSDLPKLSQMCDLRTINVKGVSGTDFML
jgi:hypothetical protein